MGYPSFPGIEIAARNARRDLLAFEEGGFDAVIFENNYDIPHVEFIDPASAACMAVIGKEIRSAAKIPVGISVLWNDYRAALAIAKVLELQFIRVPVFVDKVKTAYGIIEGRPKEIIALRKNLGARDVALLTDIHVKHAKLLSHYSLEESAHRAIAAGSDALIVTGQWTGHAPGFDEIAALRKMIGDFPMCAGSGADKDNVAELCRYANGVIASTALKEGRSKPHEVNVKSYRQRISERKAAAFVRALQNHG